MIETQELILVADDDVDVLQMLERFLKKSQFRVITAPSGIDAIDLMREHRPSAVISDIHMPGMDGLELLTRLVQMDPNLVVIITTGYPDVNNTISALRGGAADFLPKPFDLQQLKESLVSGLERRRTKLADEVYKESLQKSVEDRTRQIASLLHDIEKESGQAKDESRESIELLRRTSILRDVETGEHLERVRIAVGAVARQLGLPADEVQLIMDASPMHDLGKVGIPDKILLKPGALTPEEQEIMRTHTLIGADILDGSDSPLIRVSKMIALTHHERWDGKGYPNGLKGEEIPLYGRIVAVVDVFDALTHARCYKAASPIKEAMAIMEDGRGTQFDPQVLDALIAVVPEIIRHPNFFDDPASTDEGSSGSKA